MFFCPSTAVLYSRGLNQARMHINTSKLIIYFKHCSESTVIQHSNSSVILLLSERNLQTQNQLMFTIILVYVFTSFTPMSVILTQNPSSIKKDLATLNFVANVNVTWLCNTMVLLLHFQQIAAQSVTRQQRVVTSQWKVTGTQWQAWAEELLWPEYKNYTSHARLTFAYIHTQPTVMYTVSKKGASNSWR